MPKFGIHVVKRGYVEIDAPELDAATGMAGTLPDNAFAWEGREFEDCGPLDQPYPENKNGRYM